MGENVTADDELCDLDGCDELGHISWCFDFEGLNAEVTEINAL